MSPLTTYQLTMAGRVHNTFFGLLFSGLAIFILSAVVERHLAGKPLLWVEWLFFLPVFSLWLGFGAYCVVRALGSGKRLLVSAGGIEYRGALRELYLPWSEIRGIRVLSDRGGFGWLEVSVNDSKHKIDLTGVFPNRYAFLREASQLAPNVQVKMS